jgi:hypothetical protein
VEVIIRPQERYAEFLRAGGRSGPGPAGLGGVSPAGAAKGLATLRRPGVVDSQSAGSANLYTLNHEHRVARATRRHAEAGVELEPEAVMQAPCALLEATLVRRRTTAVQLQTGGSLDHDNKREVRR